MGELNEILKLSVAERPLAIEKIWDSINPEELTIPNSHKEEINKRLERYRSGKTKFHTWGEIKKALHSKQ